MFVHPKFVGSESGSVAVVTGVTFMLVLCAAGVAVDYSRHLSVQQTLQRDTDAALLAAAIRYRAGHDDYAATAQSMLSENWKQRSDASEVVLTVTPVDEETIEATATVEVPTVIMKIFGHDSIHISVDSEVSMATRDVEVALVLDNTGSMAGARLAGLKSAVGTLLDVVYAHPLSTDHVKMGLVPFSRYVNVGMANRDKSWMSVPPDETIVGEWCGMEAPLLSVSNCHTEPYMALVDGVLQPSVTTVCDYEYGPPVYVCRPNNTEIRWYGCAGSRDYPLNIQDSDYDTPIPGVMNATCPSQIMPLSNDPDAIRAQVDAMIATDETYMPVGLIWGLRVLSKIEPFEEASEFGPQPSGVSTRKIMILMTDGKNTVSPTYPTHLGADTAVANDLTVEVCSNIKAKGIEMFTIAFEVTDDAIKDVLRSCGNGGFYDAANSEQLENSFREIAAQMKPLHLSR